MMTETWLLYDDIHRNDTGTFAETKKYDVVDTVTLVGDGGRVVADLRGECGVAGLPEAVAQVQFNPGEAEIGQKEGAAVSDSHNTAKNASRRGDINMRQQNDEEVVEVVVIIVVEE